MRPIPLRRLLSFIQKHNVQILRGKRNHIKIKKKNSKRQAVLATHTKDVPGYQVIQILKYLGYNKEDINKI